MFASILDLIRRAAVPHGDHGGDTADVEGDLIQPEPFEALKVRDDGWLVNLRPAPHVVHVPSKRSTSLVTASKRPEMVVWHWTATTRGTAASLAKRIVPLPKPDERASSWSVLIAADGAVYQSVPFTLGSWHAGGETAEKFKLVGGRPVPGGQLSANRISVGIELECVGEVRMTNGQWRGWPFDAKSPSVPAEQVVKWQGKYYHDFTDAQMGSAAEVLRAIVRWNRLMTREACSWTHARIDPGRKTDPGPVFVERYLQKILDHAFGP